MKKQLYFFICLLYVWDAEGQLMSGYTYSALANGWLKAHEVPASFYTAFKHCENEGAVLASPSTYGLLEALKSQFYKMAFPSAMYVGIHDISSAGDYLTVDGIPMEHTPAKWSFKKIAHGKDNACLVMWKDGTVTSVACVDKHPYVCFKQVTDLPLTECGTKDTEYKLDKRTGHCYKFHRRALPWGEAFSACLSEDAHLVIINSDVEAQVIDDLFQQNPIHSIKDGYSDVAAVGISAWWQDTWYTIHGQKVQDSGYSKWEPDTYSGCGTVVRKNMLLRGVDCKFYIPFICEKEPNISQIINT